MKIKTRSNFDFEILILIKIPECTHLFISILAMKVVAINKLQFVILWLDEFFVVKFMFSRNATKIDKIFTIDAV